MASVSPVLPHTFAPRGTCAPVLLSYGDRLPTGTFIEHARFRHVANYANDDIVVSLCDETLPPGPVSLVVRGLPADGLRRMTIHPGRITVGAYSFALVPSQRWRSQLDLGGATVAGVRAGLALPHLHMTDAVDASPFFSLISGNVPRSGDTFMERVSLSLFRGVHLLFSGCEREAVEHLCGAGPGLTPSGDDFLVGHVAARHVLDALGCARFTLPFAELLNAASTTTPLAKTALMMAVEGSFASPVKCYVDALVAGRRAAVEWAGCRLLQMGSTSGADVMAGVVFTLREGIA